MEKEKKIRLSGGVFLAILRQGLRARRRIRNEYGSGDGLSEPRIFAGLLSVVYPGFEMPDEGSFKTITSNYKQCKKQSSEYIAIEKYSVVQNFDQEVRGHYSEPLSRMSKFVDDFLDKDSKPETIVKLLLRVISSDNSIKDDSEFFINKDGTSVTKSRLSVMVSISYQAFLLGIWHYIIVNCPDNTVGAETYNWLYITEPHKRPVFNSDALESDGRKLHISCASGAPVTTTTPDKVADEAAGELLPYKKYTQKIWDNYRTIKTLLYTDSPHDFYDFYVCNDVSRRVSRLENGRKVYTIQCIVDATVESLGKVSNFVIITGTGGLGKSMMMRHLLLDASKRYLEYWAIPILVTVRNYVPTYQNLMDYIYEQACRDDIGVSKDQFIETADKGLFVFLLDGLDEVSSKAKGVFEDQLNVFTKQYGSNQFILSSRPYSNFVELSRFTVLELMPLEKEQALELIEKLDYRSDKLEIKENFFHEVDNGLFTSHTEFISNPLLLTITLMTYGEFGGIEKNIRFFYRDAYQALARRHDANKGGFKRELKTGLEFDDFTALIAEFSALTYRDEKYELTEDEMERYYAKLHNRKNGTNAAAFIADMTNGVCLMYYEGGEYRFIHRSFQEYFCALFFSRLKDKKLPLVGQIFEKHRGWYADKTFSMLYDMIPEKVKEFIFAPFLKRLFEKCDTENGYETFLLEIYPDISYLIGETDDSSMRQDARSYVYKMIVEINHFPDEIPDDYEMPDYHEWCADSTYVYARVDEEDDYYESTEVRNADDISEEYIERYGEPEECGYSLTVNLKTAIEEREDYEEFFDRINNPEFVLYRQYQKAREYYKEIVDDCESNEDDLFAPD